MFVVPPTGTPYYYHGAAGKSSAPNGFLTPCLFARWRSTVCSFRTPHLVSCVHPFLAWCLRHSDPPENGQDHTYHKPWRSKNLTTLHINQHYVLFSSGRGSRGQTHVALIGRKTSNRDGTAHSRAFIEGDWNSQPREVCVAQSDARPCTFRLTINANLRRGMGERASKRWAETNRDKRLNGK